MSLARATFYMLAGVGAAAVVWFVWILWRSIVDTVADNLRPLEERARYCYRCKKWMSLGDAVRAEQGVEPEPSVCDACIGALTGK